MPLPTRAFPGFCDLEFGVQHVNSLMALTDIFLYFTSLSPLVALVVHLKLHNRGMVINAGKLANILTYRPS